MRDRIEPLTPVGRPIRSGPWTAVGRPPTDLVIVGGETGAPVGRGVDDAALGGGSVRHRTASCGRHSQGARRTPCQPSYPLSERSSSRYARGPPHVRGGEPLIQAVKPSNKPRQLMPFWLTVRRLKVGSAIVLWGTGSDHRVAVRSAVTSSRQPRPSRRATADRVPPCFPRTRSFLRRSRAHCQKHSTGLCNRY
jgi:hypothetical protein